MKVGQVKIGENKFRTFQVFGAVQVVSELSEVFDLAVKLSRIRNPT